MEAGATVVRVLGAARPDGLAAVLAKTTAGVGTDDDRDGRTTALAEHIADLVPELCDRGSSLPAVGPV